jgi:hypothetical protein
MSVGRSHEQQYDLIELTIETHIPFIMPKDCISEPFSHELTSKPDRSQTTLIERIENCEFYEQSDSFG